MPKGSLCFMIFPCEDWYKTFVPFLEQWAWMDISKGHESLRTLHKNMCTKMCKKCLVNLHSDRPIASGRQGGLVPPPHQHLCPCALPRTGGGIKILCPHRLILAYGPAQRVLQYLHSLCCDYIIWLEYFTFHTYYKELLGISSMCHLDRLEWLIIIMFWYVNLCSLFQKWNNQLKWFVFIIFFNVKFLQNLF